MAMLICISLTAHRFPGYGTEEIPTNRLYRNNGDSTFTDVTEIAGVSVIPITDTDALSAITITTVNLDLYVTNYGVNRLYRNNGDGTFTDVAEAAGVTEPRWSTSCAFADYDQRWQPRSLHRQLHRL